MPELTIAFSDRQLQQFFAQLVSQAQFPGSMAEYVSAVKQAIVQAEIKEQK